MFDIYCVKEHQHITVPDSVSLHLVSSLNDFSYHEFIDSLIHGGESAI